MAETLAPLVYGKVIGRFLAMVADGPEDANDFPDGVPLTGDITFTPQVSSVIVPSATPAPTTVLPMPIKATLDADGYVTLNGKPGVYLLASNDPATEPTGYTYSVSFAGLRYNGGIVRYADFNITVLAGQTIDLSLVAPVGATTGTIVVADTTVLNRALLEVESRTAVTFTKVNQDVADARFVADNAHALGTQGVADAATAQRAADRAYVKPSTGIPDDDINGELVTNSRRGGDVYGRFDVSAQNVSQRDLNDITNSGQYRGYQMVNGPAQFPTGWWYIEVIKHDADWVFQRITGFTDAQAERTFVRHKNAGAWRSWVETGTYLKPFGGIPESDLTSEVAAKLNKPSGTNVLVLASSTSTVPAGTPANTLVITPSSATA
jgi:hypothetical protein